MKKCALLLTLLASCGKVQTTPPPQGDPGKLKPQESSYSSETVASSPGAFVTKEGCKGWKTAIPGGRPLATPAYAEGRLYIGGGFGSNEFYCLDSETGKVLWEYKTGDDGPTAAVVEDGCVVFNTESCTIYTLAADTGKLLWSKWLGDPLLSQPAIASGKVYMAYPGKDGSHHLTCMDLKDGKAAWDQKIAGDIIAAPVVQGGSVYLTTFDGTVYRYGAMDGNLAWSEKRDATSPPWIWGDQVLVSQGKDVETSRGIFGKSEVMTMGSAGGGKYANVFGGKGPAHYLDTTKQGGTGGMALQKEIPADAEKMKVHQKSFDSGVGFASAPESAKLEMADKNVGVKTVCGAWAYQGSRPSIAGDRCYAAMGDILFCHDLKRGGTVWERSIKPPKTVEGMRLLAPPALANGKVFLSTSMGDVLCMDGQGQILWSFNVGEPIVFQPAVMKGKVFVGTSGGHVVAIETGDPRDHGWPMWGGSPAHNGPP